MWASAALRSPCPETRHHKSRALGAEVRSLRLERPSRRVKAGRAAPARQAVEASHVGPDVHLLLLGQSGSHERQGRVETPPNGGVRNFPMKNGAERLSRKLRKA